MMAGRQDTQVELCAGRYDVSLPIIMSASGMTLNGKAGDRPEIRYTHPRFKNDGRTAIQIGGTGQTIRNLDAVLFIPRYWEDNGGALVSGYASSGYPDPADGLVLDDLTLSSITRSRRVNWGVRLDALESGRTVAGAKNVEIRDVVIRGVHQGIRLRSGDNTTIENTTIRTAESPIYLSSVGRTDIRNVTAESRSRCIWLDQDDHAVGISTVEGVDCTVNEIAAGLHFSSPRNTSGSQRQLVVRDNQFTITDTYPGRPALDLRLNDPETELVIAGNDLNRLGGSGIHLNTSTQRTSRVRIINNVIRTIRDRSEAVEVRDAERFNDLEIINNSIRIRPSQNSFWDHGVTMRLETTASSYTGALPITFANNLVVSTDPTRVLDVGIQPAAGRGPYTITSKSNLFYANFSTIYDGVSAGTPNDVIGQDPLITGPLLEVPANSPAVDAGDCTYAPAADYLGVARPQGGSCDIGAYEQ